jgi:DNA polymerase I-like protein with 3'-5' exonuclease and polymerase domains
MFKQGIFVDRYGDTHSVFVIEDKNYYRFDITRKDAKFQIDTGAVEFSLIRRKQTHVYGNQALYDDFNELFNLSNSVRCKFEQSSEWNNGKYVTKHLKTKEDMNFMEETLYANGSLESQTVQCGNRLAAVFTVSEYGGIRMDPVNFDEYVEKQLGEITNADLTSPYYPLNMLEAKFDLTHLDDKDMCVADTLDVARKRLAAYDNAGDVFRGFDTETTGLDVDLYGNDKLVGIVLSWNESEATYYPFRHAKIDNLPMEFLDELVTVLIRHQAVTIAHNKKFDRKVMLKEGYDIRVKHDTLDLSFLVNPVIGKGLHALKSLMFDMDGHKYLELDDIFTSDKLIDFSVLPKDLVRVYVCPDGFNLIRLFKHLWTKLPKYTRNLYDVEADLTDIKADQEYYGLRVDVPKFLENMDNCNYVLAMLEKAVRQLTRIDGNINSSFVLSDLLYNKMGCPVLERTKTGKPSTGMGVIKKLAKAEASEEKHMTSDMVDKFGKVIIKASDLNKSKYPALVVLEQYRVYMKLHTAFYSRFERTVKHGRIFFWINQNGAASGRQSSPMHQLPPELKEIIISDSDDHEMWDPDYSQVELRMIAYLAGETDLIEMCKDPENDIHRVIGALITGLEMWEISSEMRKRDKTRNFGVVYLISKYGLANQMFGAGSSRKKECLEIAEQSLNDFYNRFKRIRKYIANNANIVKQDGFVTTRFGRNRYFREIFDPDIPSKRKASLIRQANNTPVQGSSADYLKIAEVNFDVYIRSKGWNVHMQNGLPRVRIALSIHDEIILMVDKTIPYEEIMLMIRSCMEIPVEGAPPFFCSPAKVDNWEQHDDDSVVVPVKLRDKLIEDYTATGISKINKDNYDTVLNDYREGLLNDYMQNLINEYGNDPDRVAEAVRHPTLTHSLLARYRPPKHMEHKEHIRYAVGMYINNTGAVEQVRKEVEHKTEIFPELEELVNFNEKGDVIYDTWDEETEDSGSWFDDEQFIEKMTGESESVKVWELGDALCVDTSELEPDEINAVLSEMWKYRDDKGFYKVYILYADTLRDTGFMVEDLPKSDIAKMIKEYEDGRRNSKAG